MSSKRAISSFLALILALALGPFALADDQAKPAKAGSEKAPQLTIVDPIKDFGTVAKGEKLDWSFLVKNSGSGELQILSAQPSCGCTVADFDKTVAPGKTGKVTAHVDTTNFSGPISKQVTLQTNDPNVPSAQLTIRAVVKPFVEVFPSGFVRFNVMQGDAQMQSVTLYSEEEEPFEILGVDVPGDFVKAGYRKIENPEELAKGGRPGQNQYRFDITLGGPTAKVGPLAEKLIIHTNSKHQPTFPISITGLVRPTYTVMPTVLNFGEIGADDPAAERSVRVKSNDLEAPQAFQVTKVESTNPSVSAVAKPSDQAGEYDVTVKLAKNATPGAIEGDLKIYTSDKINPTVTIPLRGAVKADKPASK